jgi:phosphoesterase RecJ-like protein
MRKEGRMDDDQVRKEFEDIAGLVRRHDSFLILGHIDPDGDCIGSMLALARFLRAKGKSIKCYAPGEIAGSYLRLPDADMLSPECELTGFEHRVVFTLDSPTLARTADLVKPSDGLTIVNIDHHPTNERYGTVNIVGDTTSAAAILVYRLLSVMDRGGIDREIADYLYLGILMDTGGFRFQNTDAESLACASELVRLGARPHDLAHEFIFMKSYSTLMLLAGALGSLELHCGDRLAIMEVTRSMIRESGGSMNDTEGFVDYPASVETIELCALFREIGPREVRVSLRSRSELDVDALAERYGGGGHRKAAGLTMHEDMETAKSRLTSDLSSMLEGTGRTPS